MADVSSAPAIGSPTGLYPQPPQQQPALGSNPGQMIDLLGKIQQNYALQQELKARAAIGQAYQGALQPDGTLDAEKLRGGLANPDASWMLPETMSHVLAQRGSQFDLLAKQDAAARSLIGSLPPNANDEELRHYATRGVRAGIPADMMAGHVDALMRLPPKDRARAIAVLQGTALGPGGVSERVPGAPTESGAPTQTSKGSVILNEATSPGGVYRGTATGQPPGQAELQQASAASAARLEASANTTSQYHADLDNLLQLSRNIPLQGPTTEWEKKLNQVAGRLGLPGTLTKDQLANTEEFVKISNQLSANQASVFGGTDAAREMAVRVNPNIELSQGGKEAVIHQLAGNQDAVDTLRKQWFNTKRQYKKDTGQEMPANTFNDFVQEASDRIHPRVFQFMRMNPESQAKFLDGVSDKGEFERQLTDADRRGWIKLPKGEEPSGPAPRASGAPKTQGRAPQGEPFRTLPPEESAPPPKPPIPGVKLGRHTDGSPRWYIEDQARPGKYLEVKQPFPGLGQ